MKGKAEKLREVCHQYRHAWVLSYLIFYLIWWACLEQKVTRRFHIVHMAVDDKIPFLEVFVIPYILWFLYMAVVVAYFFFRDVQDYYKLCAFLFTGMTVFLIVSTVYPNGHCLRPRVFERDNIFVDLVKVLYGTDTPTNLFPSIHVYNSIGVHISLLRSERLKGKKWARRCSFLLMASIIASTMFLKQHSAFDVITGGAMAAAVYPLVYGGGWQAVRKYVCEKYKTGGWKNEYRKQMGVK